MFGLFVDIDDKGKIGLYQKGNPTLLDSDTFLKLTEREYEQVERLRELGLSKKDIYYVFSDSVVTLIMSKEDQKKLEELNDKFVDILESLSDEDFEADGTIKSWAKERVDISIMALKQVVADIYSKYLGDKISFNDVTL